MLTYIAAFIFYTLAMIGVLLMGFIIYKKMIMPQQENKGMINGDNLCYGVARIGSDTQIVCAGKIKDVILKDFGKPLHSVVICAKTLSSIEKEVVEFYSK